MTGPPQQREPANDSGGSPVVRMTDLVAEFDEIRPEVSAAIGRVLDRGHFTSEVEVESLENAIQQECGCRFAVGVASGSAALSLAILACDVGPGDEVITVSNTDIAVGSAINHAGADIVWADIELGTLNIDPDCIVDRIMPATKVLVVTHMHGRPADMERLVPLAKEHNLVMIEDAALAWGAEYHGRRVGTMSAIGCFSFAPTKVLGGIGDSGACLTDDPDLASRLRTLRNYGHRDVRTSSSQLSDLDWTFIEDGFNARMDEVQAATLSIRLGRASGYIARRRAIAARYSQLLEGLPIGLPTESPDSLNVYRAYTILTDERDSLRRHLADAEIETRVYYAPSLHLQPVYVGRGRCRDSLAETEKADREALSLPIHPSLRDADVEYVAEAVAAFFGVNAKRPRGARLN